MPLHENGFVLITFVNYWTNKTQLAKLCYYYFKGVFFIKFETKIVFFCLRGEFVLRHRYFKLSSNVKFR